MKYLVRALKYFFYLAIILILVIVALILLGMVETDIDAMFVHGSRSLWQMAGILVIFAAIYPKFGFTRRMVHLGGAYEDTRSDVIKVMQARGYVLISEQDNVLRFRPRSVPARVLKMLEDTITLSWTFGGYEIEGLTRDVARLHPALERIQDQNSL